MSIDVCVENIVNINTASDVTVTGSSDASVCVSPLQELQVQKKEYSIVGDGLYASISTDEAPEWLTAIIDSLIDIQLAGSLSDLSDLRGSIIQALEDLEVARNDYQELINIEATIDRIITSRLTTLNASLDQANANIITLQLTTVTASQAAAIAVTQINSSLNDGAIGSSINQINMTISTLDETIANMYTVLTSSMEGIGESVSEVEVVANVLKDRLEASWSYNSKLLLADGRWYKSGFGLKTSAVTGGDGSEGNPFSSEFWINAQKLKFTNDSESGSVTPFTIDATGATPNITFRGNVVINNRGTAVEGGIPTFLGNFANPPAAIVRGDSYKNTSDNTVYTWDGTGWISTSGTDGVDGTNGRGITSTTINYQVSTSGTVVPTGTWLTGVPTVPAGQFLWTRTIFSYSDSTSSTTYSTARQGTDGKGISTSQVHYQVSNSGTVIPTGTWVSSVPFVGNNQFLWTRTTLTFTDGTSQASYSVSRQGASGTDGEDGSRGAGFFRIGTSNGLWDNAAAILALPDQNPVKDDTVTIFQIGNPGNAATRMWSGFAWVAPALSVHGDMVVDGTIVSQKIATSAIQGMHIENSGITAVKFDDWLISGSSTNPTTAPLALNFRNGNAYMRNVFARGDIEASTIRANAANIVSTLNVQGGAVTSMTFSERIAAANVARANGQSTPSLSPSAHNISALTTSAISMVPGASGVVVIVSFTAWASSPCYVWYDLYRGDGLLLGTSYGSAIGDRALRISDVFFDGDPFTLTTYTLMIRAGANSAGNGDGAFSFDRVKIACTGGKR